jgi:hypothetical protein
VYLAEVTVSGRIAATFPLPLATSDFRAVIAEKLLVREPTEIDGTDAAEPVLLELGVELLLEQAERAMPVPRAVAAKNVLLVNKFKQTTSSVAGSRKRRGHARYLHRK